MSHQQTGLANFGTNTNNDPEKYTAPDPELIRMYTVTGRLVTGDDTQDTAPQREDSPFTLSIYHYPVQTEHQSDHPLFRVCFGADQHAWFDLEYNNLKELTKEFTAYTTSHHKFSGAHFTTAPGPAEFTNGLLGVCFDQYTIGDSKMLTIQVGETVGTGASADLTPAQTTDLKTVFRKLTDADPSALSETRSLPIDKGAITETGENTYPGG